MDETTLLEELSVVLNEDSTLLNSLKVEDLQPIQEKNLKKVDSDYLDAWYKLE